MIDHLAKNNPAKVTQCAGFLRANAKTHREIQ